MRQPDKDKSRVLLGEITGAHGIRGEVMVRSHAATPQGIAAYGPLDDGSGTRSFTLTVVRVTPKGVVARIAGLADRTSAEKLRGTKLYVPRDRLPAAAENEFYHADLVGLAAFDTSGARIGEIAAVHNFGAGDILEIRLDGGKETELVAFTSSAVPEVDIAGGRAVIVLPETDVAQPEGSEE